MGDHRLLFLEPLVDSIPADADEPLCKPLFVKPRAVTKQIATHIFRRKAPGGQAVLLVQHPDIDTVGDDFAAGESADAARKGLEVFDALRREIEVEPAVWAVPERTGTYRQVHRVELIGRLKSVTPPIAIWRPTAPQ